MNGVGSLQSRSPGDLIFTTPRLFCTFRSTATGSAAHASWAKSTATSRVMVLMVGRDASTVWQPAKDRARSSGSQRIPGVIYSDRTPDDTAHHRGDHGGSDHDRRLCQRAGGSAPRTVDHPGGSGP